MSDITRQLKIKTGSVKRLCKELILYRKEQTDSEKKLEELREAGSEMTGFGQVVMVWRPG